MARTARTVSRVPSGVSKETAGDSRSNSPIAPSGGLKPALESVFRFLTPLLLPVLACAIPGSVIPVQAWADSIPMYIHYDVNGGTINNPPSSYTLSGGSVLYYRLSGSQIHVSTDGGSSFHRAETTIYAGSPHNDLMDPGMPNIKKTGYHTEGDKAWRTSVNNGNILLHKDDQAGNNVNVVTTKRINQGTEITGETNVTIYANWIANTYSIVYDCGEGSWQSGQDPGTLNATYGTTSTLTTRIPQHPTQVFIGWNSQPDGSGISYPPGAAVLNLSSDYGATVVMYAQYGDVSSKITNTYRPGFDVTVYKDGPTPGDNSTYSPVGGAKFDIFKISGLGTATASPSLPATISSKASFNQLFTLGNNGHQLDYAVDDARAAGLEYITTITSGTDGYAMTTECALDSGSAYAIIEVFSPNGYLLGNESGDIVLYVIDDKVSIGGQQRYAHILYTDSYAGVDPGHAGKQADFSSTDGSEIPHTTGANGIEYAGFTGYKVVLSSSVATAAPDNENRFRNPRDPSQVFGGLQIRKVDLDSPSTGVEGAMFAVWQESVFQAKYALYQAAKQQAGEEASDAEFLEYLTSETVPVAPEPDEEESGDDSGDDDGGETVVDSGDDEEEEEEEPTSPYYAEPIYTFEATDEDGWAFSSKTELPLGSYRVVEVRNPDRYDPPEYDFSAASGGTGGNGGSSVVQLSTAYTLATAAPIANKFDPPPDPDPVPIKAWKTLETGELQVELHANDYQFMLYRTSDEKFTNPLITVSNDAEGKVVFGSVKWDAANSNAVLVAPNGTTVLDSVHFEEGEGSVSYTILEKIPSDARSLFLEGTYSDYLSNHSQDTDGGVRSASDISWYKELSEPANTLLFYDSIIYDIEASFTKRDDSQMAISLSPDDSLEFINITEDRWQSRDPGSTLTVRKVDSEYNGLAGATFTVFSQDAPDEPFATTFSVEGGFAYFDLPAGTYTVRETEPPEGYALNTEWVQTVTLDGEHDVTIYEACVNSPALPPPTGFIIGGAGIAAAGIAVLLARVLGARRRGKGALSNLLARSQNED